MSNACWVKRVHAARSASSWSSVAAQVVELAEQRAAAGEPLRAIDALSSRLEPGEPPRCRLRVARPPRSRSGTA